MLERFKTAYANYWWARWLFYLGLSASAVVHFELSGGLPPKSWLLLLQVMPTIPQLWGLRGTSMLLPLGGLVAMALTVLILWGLICLGVSWCLLQAWDSFQERRRFNAEFEVAQAVAYVHDEEQEWALAESVYAQVARQSSTGSKVATTLQPDTRHTSQFRQAGLDLLEPDPWKPVETPEEFSDDAWLTAPGPIVLPSAKQEARRTVRFMIGTELDTGHARKYKANEDNLFATQGVRTSEGNVQSYGLFIVADGMGGHAHGSEASKLAVEKIKEAIIPALTSKVAFSEQDYRELLLEGVQKANFAIYRLNQQNTEMMGTTLTAALVIDTTAYVVNVGDSRTYRFSSSGELYPVTEDHSLVALYVKEGVIKSEDIYTHPRRNEILRCVGERATVEADLFVLTLEEGDALMLCSDGVWEMVRDTTIQAVLQANLPDAVRASRELVEAALDGGGLDNISVIVACVTY